MPTLNIVNPTVTDAVREKYGGVADSTLTNDSAGVRKVAEAFGYSADELASIPAEANMGLSCGNPTAMASLGEGETVVDLGCGGGLDVFLAAKKVGPTGRAIGIDMTPAMIDRARRNAVGMGNVEFHLSTIDALPLADASVDLHHQQLRHQLGRGQGGRPARRVPRPQARRPVRRQRHRDQA